MTALRSFDTRRFLWGAALALGPLTLASPAAAGAVSQARIAATTPDGRVHAVFFMTESWVDGPAALVKMEQPTAGAYGLPKLATAHAGEKMGPPLPFARWKWDGRPPELSKLRVFSHLFDDKSAGKHARIVQDMDTGMMRLEILQAERWLPVRALPGDTPMLTGTIVLPDRYLIRVLRERDIAYWDEIYPVTVAEVPELGARWLRARAEAATATAALRELREKGERPFTKRPSGARNQQGWDYRREKALDPVIEKWECAKAFGPLTAQDLRDMLFVLSARAKPGHKLEALRSFLRLRDRDPKSAEALLVDLEKDPDVGALVPILRKGFDPLRNFEVPVWAPRTADELRKLGNDELLWVHRALWALFGFRFAEPEVNEYFALFSWYRPVPEKQWQGLLKNAFFMKDPNRSALVHQFHLPTLKALAEVEKERGLSPPAL
jgi:hypothetical protein